MRERAALLGFLPFLFTAPLRYTLDVVYPSPGSRARGRGPSHTKGARHRSQRSRSNRRKAQRLCK